MKYFSLFFIAFLVTFSAVPVFAQIDSPTVNTGDNQGEAQDPQEPTEEPVVNEDPSVTTDEEAQEKRQALVVERTPAQTIKDTDGDGITDYDEIHLYGTDPNSAVTTRTNTGDPILLTDSDKILEGINPLTNERIVYEDPRIADSALVTLGYTVDTIISDADNNTNADVTEPVTVTFKGTAPASSFVTLQIFSTPIVVTVKSDSNGLWSYSLNQEIEDGTHEIFVTTVDNTGRILARSSSIPFVKTAAAAGFAGQSLSDTTSNENTFFSIPVLLVLVLVFVIFIVGAITFAGAATKRKMESTNTEPTQAGGQNIDTPQ